MPYPAAVIMGSVLAGVLSLTNLDIGLSAFATYMLVSNTTLSLPLMLALVFLLAVLGVTRKREQKSAELRRAHIEASGIPSVAVSSV